MLMIPGPSQPDPRVLAALSLPVRPHYGKDWAQIYNDTTAKLQKIFSTKKDVIIVPIPGQVAVEMSVVNLVGRGGEGFVCSNGTFSSMISEMIESIGGKAKLIVSEAGRGTTADQVAQVLDNSGDVSGRPLFLVHTETSTGATSSPAEIFKVCKKKGMITVLDCISTFGGMEVRSDEWGADYTIGYASKALGGIFGAQPVAIGEEAWRAAAANRSRISNHFFNLNVWRKSIDEDSSWGHPYPSSMPTSVIVALQVAAGLALEEGLDNRYRRHAEAAKSMRKGLSDLGLDLFTDPRFFSNTVSVANVEASWEADLRKLLLQHYDIMISGGLGALAGRIVRIGHMGTSANQSSVAITLAALANLLPTVRRG